MNYFKWLNPYDNDELSEFSEEELATREIYNTLIKSYKNKYGIDFHVVSIIDNDSKDQLKDNSEIMDLLRHNEFLNNLMFPNYSFEMSHKVNIQVDDTVNKTNTIL